MATSNRILARPENSTSEATAVDTADRIVDCATILRFTGKSFRKLREIVGAPLED